MVLSTKQMIIDAVKNTLLKVKDITNVYAEGQTMEEQKVRYPCFFIVDNEPEESAFGTNRWFISALKLKVVFITNEKENVQNVLNKYIDLTRNEIFKEIKLRFGVKEIDNIEIEDTTIGTGKAYFEDSKRGVDPSFPIFVMVLMITYRVSID